MKQKPQMGDERRKQETKHELRLGESGGGWGASLAMSMRGKFCGRTILRTECQGRLMFGIVCARGDSGH
jgi:hypothetical protein